MDILSVVLFLVLIMVAYSCGAAIFAGPGQVVTPSLVDLGALAILWFFGLITCPALGKSLALLVWLPAAVILAGCITRIRLGSQPVEKTRSVTNRTTAWWRLAWEGWKSFSARMGNYQGRMLLVLFYFAVITPWGFIVRFFSDPLHVRRTSTASYWIQRESLQADIEEAQRQF
jgi:hypothetical protein